MGGVSASRCQGCPLAKNLVRYSFVLATGGELGDVVANVFKRLSRVLFPIFSEYICVAPVLFVRRVVCKKLPDLKTWRRTRPAGGVRHLLAPVTHYGKKIYIYI